MKNLICSFIILSLLSCSKDDDEIKIDTTGNQVQIQPNQIWNGPKITFSKNDNADPSNKINQDSISPSVTITRGSSGEIYNVTLEDVYSKYASPLGTKWAIGELSNASNLTFAAFRSTIKPQEVIGKSLVLYIEKEDAYLSVKFSAWGQGSGGSFKYERSTKEE